jgi:diguanylate cyclase (GGDEF)-like protein/PAS domain S-box-containing protein
MQQSGVSDANSSDCGAVLKGSMNSQILIVTNDASDAAELQDALHSARDGPYTIVLLRQLSEALKRLSKDDIDAILVDLVLPDSQGIETFDKVFAAAPHVPILTLSTLKDEALAIEAVQRGAQGYLSKGHFSSYLVPQSLRNIIQRKTVELTLYIEKERAAITLNSISDAVIGTDMNGNVDYLNAAAELMTGWTKEEVRGRPISEVMPLINGKTRESVRNPIELVLVQKKPIELPVDTVILRRGGFEAIIEDSTAPICDARGEVVGAVMVFHDVTSTQTMSRKMAHLAQHDVLTNLPNRLLLNDRIAHAIVHAKRNRSSAAVLFMDLDKFKNINDSLGHEMGDKLLQSVAERLSNCVRASDTVSRLGGDEFVILLSETNHAEDVTTTAEKIIAASAAPYVIDKHELYMTTSMGVSLYPADGNTPETLLKNADTAMYHAKQQGRNNYQFFTSALNLRAVERQVIESNLRRAIERNELMLHFQPKVNLNTGGITGLEALVRWMHPTWGMTFPARFIHIAEDCGMIIAIGRWVLRAACIQAVKWESAGLNPGTIAVNVSSLEFRHKDFVKGVRDILAETKLLPQNLQLEITESVLMQDVGSSIDVLTQIKAIGVGLAVDDFGTGYSSLSYLMQFPIDVLKIDQSFVKNVTTTENNSVIVSAVIGMGKSLNQRVIAEGVENRRQLDFLKTHRCEEGQGYYFSRPVDADKFEKLLISGFKNLLS